MEERIAEIISKVKEEERLLCDFKVTCILLRGG